MRRGQSTICAFWRSNLSSRSWWQAPLGAEPIYGKVCCYFGSPVARAKTRNGSRDSGPLMLHNYGQTDDPRDCLSWLLLPGSTNQPAPLPSDDSVEPPGTNAEACRILYSIPPAPAPAPAPQRRGRPGQSFVGGSGPFLPWKPGIHCDGIFPKAALSRVGGGELGSLMRC